jgi:hypothetical protein
MGREVWYNKEKRRKIMKQLSLEEKKIFFETEKWKWRKYTEEEREELETWEQEQWEWWQKYMNTKGDPIIKLQKKLSKQKQRQLYYQEHREELKRKGRERYHRRNSAIVLGFKQLIGALDELPPISPSHSWDEYKQKRGWDYSKRRGAEREEG